MLHIAGADWLQRVEVCDSSVNKRNISVFSNQDEVELFIMGSHWDFVR